MNAEKNKSETANKSLVLQPFYPEDGFLNYDSKFIKKSELGESHVIKTNVTSTTSEFVSKAQPCGNAFINRCAIRKSVLISGNSIDGINSRQNFLPARQPSYSECGILNYESQTIQKPISNEVAKSHATTENEIYPLASVAAKIQLCEKIDKSCDGHRESICPRNIINKGIISKNQGQPKSETTGQPSHAENGIFKSSQINKDHSSNVVDKEMLNDVSSASFKTCIGGISPTRDSTNDALESPNGIETPARSRIIARVKNTRSFAVLSEPTNGELPECAGSGNNERKVLVIYTGGTIGMVKNASGVLEPIKGAFEERTRAFPQLHELSYWRKRFADEDNERDKLVLPVVKDLDVRIIYKIHEKEVLLDSSNITPEDWTAIARYIQKNYDLYDGFVVLHGTDTLAYTASALSFMLENLGKPVVITGSQIPIFEPRSDGADNFVSALIVAGGLYIPEVTVMFGSKLFRGNRTRKISSYNFHAFDSPNFVSLVEFGIDIELNNKAVFRPTTIEKCSLHERMSKNVGIIRIFPGITPGVMRAFLQPPIEGVVLESYGSGNIPTNKELFHEIKDAVKRGVIIVNITQCASGSVAGSPAYETGRLIQACGVISGYDMTTEAALAKVAYVLTKHDWCLEKKIEMMTSNIRGELTNLKAVTLEDNSLIDALASSLKITSPKQLIEVTDKVFTALLLHAIDKEDEITIQRIQELGAEVNSQNCEGKTPLHIAIYKENLNIVKYLLLRGANVHVKTRSGESPLLTAIQRDNHPIIRILLKCGADLASCDNQVVTELLCLASRRGALQRLESLRLAGADFNLSDEIRQTPLHKAVMSERPEAVKFILERKVRRFLPDVLNNTPLDYARQLGYEEIVSMLER